MLKQSIVEIITPFDKGGNIDQSALKKIIDFQIKNGTDSIIILSATGESTSLNAEERELILKIAVKTADKRVKIITAIEEKNIFNVAEQIKSAESDGADAILLSNSRTIIGTEAGIIEYYLSICKNSSLSFILENFNPNKNYSFSPEILLKIIDKCPNIIGIKETSGNISRISRFISIKPPSTLIYSGEDNQILPMSALGLSGAISTLANMFPKEIKLLTESALNGDLTTAKRLNNSYLPIIELLSSEPAPILLKYLCSIIGLCENYTRIPLTQASEALQNKIKSEFDKLKKEGLFFSSL